MTVLDGLLEGCRVIVWRVLVRCGPHPGCRCKFTVQGSALEIEMMTIGISIEIGDSKSLVFVESQNSVPRNSVVSNLFSRHFPKNHRKRNNLSAIEIILCQFSFCAE